MKRGYWKRRDFIKTMAGGAAAITIPSWLAGCGPTPAAEAPVNIAQNTSPMPSDYFETHFGVTVEMIQKVLTRARSRGGDWADLYFQHKVSSYVGLEDQSVNRAYSSVDLGVGIRVVSGDQTGYAYTEVLTLEAMLAAADTASAISKGASPIAAMDLTPQRFAPRYDTTVDWQSVGVDQIIPVLTGLDEGARGAEPWVQRVSLGFGSSQSRVMIVDGDGRVSFDNQPMTRLSMSVVMEKDGVRQSNGHNIAARDGFSFYDDARRKALLDKALSKTRILFESQQPPAGEMPVVLAAGSSGILLHEAIGHGMEADFNRKGTSIFADRIGEKVADENVTIVDSGLEEGFRGAINVDDEGALPQSTMLVEKGILRSYMHDRISAKHYGVDQTGSGRRQSFRHPPLPRMRNTYMLPGPHAKDEIIANVKKGIYAQTFTNGQVKIGAGDYSFYVKNGYLIEDGKLTAPIKDANIIGNGPESLSRITMVGDDFLMDEGGWTCGKGGQSVPVSLGLPTVLVSNITVGGVS